MQATAEEKSVWQDAFHTFRHGDDTVCFSGFNDNATTGWTTHATGMREAGKKNSEVKAEIAMLAKTGDNESRKLELQKQIIDIPKTFGFCKPVGFQEAITHINKPSVQSQKALNRKKGASTSARTACGSTMPAIVM